MNKTKEAKRVSAIILSLVLAISLVGCVSTSDEELKEPSNVTIGSNTEDKQGDEQKDNEQKDDKNQGETSEESQKTEATVSETVLVDESGVKITAKSLKTDGFLGPKVKLLIENNSGKDLTFQCRDSSVNGYMVQTMMSVNVVNGKKANDDLTFVNSDLETCGIETIADMEFAFHIFESSGWKTFLDTDMITLKTSAADTFEYIYDDSGSLAYEGNDIKVVVKGLAEEGSFFGPRVVVYVENVGNRNVTVQARDVSVNGFMVDSIFSCNVAKGKRAVDTITFMDSSLEENDITEIESIDLSFHIYDSDKWATIADTEVVNIVF